MFQALFKESKIKTGKTDLITEEQEVFKMSQTLIFSDTN